jgi:hypothetical protein
MAHSIAPSMPQPTVAREYTRLVSTSASTATRRLLACGMIAGPLFVAVGLIQALTIPGFDLTRHALSLLETGPFGGIQIANFLISGSLLLAYAAGLRQAWRRSPGGRWAPLLVGVCGLGFIGGGLFHPDPGLGFPPGTSPDIPPTMSTSGLLHLVFGSTAFLALIAACFVLARAFAVARQRSWAVGLAGAGATFALGLGETLAGGPAGSLVLFLSASVALIAVALTAARLRSEPAIVAVRRRQAIA